MLGQLRPSIFFMAFARSAVLDSAVLDFVVLDSAVLDQLGKGGSSNPSGAIGMACDRLKFSDAFE